MTTTITPAIVILNTTVTQAAQSPSLQQNGAIVSYGGTTLATNATSFVGNLSQLSSILQPAAALSSLSWSSGTVTASIAQGTLPANTYYYKITALGPTGETIGSNEVSVTTTGATSAVILTWGAAANATGYKIYRGTAAGDETLYFSVGTVTTFTDIGGAGTSGSVPITNTTTLPAPTQTAPSTATTGGTLAAGTYYYKVAAINTVGETTGSNEESIVTTGTTSENTINWGAVTGATGYKIYRGTTSGSENVYYQVGLVTTFSDTGAAGTSGTVPASNTTTINPPVANVPTFENTYGSLTEAVGTNFTVTIAGATPAGYNGTYLATVASATTFTYPLAMSPGLESSPGTYTPPSSAFLTDAFTTFFAQGTAVGAYVLELGAEASDASGIAALQTWLNNNDSPQQFYTYLLPSTWDADDAVAINTLAKNYSSSEGLHYFFVTTTTANLSIYAGTKSVQTFVPSPTAAAGEFGAAAPFYQWLINNPGSANPLAPMSYRFLYGLTPWVQKGNGSAINGVLTGFGNLSIPAAEGGLSNAMLVRGTTMDGAQASAWYGVDWFQINVKQALAAAIINGSNNNPPLLYDQNGINSLLAVAQGIANSAIAFGCAATATVSAVPFATYIAQNPNDYANGVYKGLSCNFTSQNGFLTVTFNLDAVQIA